MKRIRALVEALGYAEPLTKEDGKTRFLFATMDAPPWQIGVTEGFPRPPKRAFLALERSPEGVVGRAVIHEDSCKYLDDGTACACPALKWLREELHELGMPRTQ